MIPKALRHALTAAILLSCAVPAIADPNMVVMKNFDYSPMSLTVPVGATVTWKNLDGEPHTVVSIDGAFRSQALDQNDTYSFTFKKAGTYKYVCSIHPKMMAAIVVK
ncbi:MAG TPA: cupredoxin family copper-binding protein [Rhizomicrobium sp.]|jgi:plastocyanin